MVASPGLLVRMYRGKSRWCMIADVWNKLLDVSGVEQKSPVAGYCAQGATIAEAVEFVGLTF